MNQRHISLALLSVFRSRAATRASTRARQHTHVARSARCVGAALSLCGLLALPACSSLKTLTVRPSQPSELSLVPAPRLSEHRYKRVLIVPPEEGVSVSERIESQVPTARDTRFYTGEVEKILLAKGFEVVSSEIVARAKSASASGKYSFAERALVLGRGTHADAVLSIQKLAVEDQEKFYHRQDLSEVAPAERSQDDDGHYFHRKTEQCLYRLPLYRVVVSAKLIDVQGGDVLWVGEGSESSLDTMPASWVAKLDDECQVREQVPFNYRDYLAGEEAYDRTVKDLFMRLFEPLRVRALTPGQPPPVLAPAAASVPAATPSAAPAAAAPPIKLPGSSSAPAPHPAPAARAHTATISSGRAILREVPEHEGLRINLVPRRSKVEVMQSSGEWHKIKLEDGTVGWMHDDSLLLDP
jgi:hypothetical protein